MDAMFGRCLSFTLKEEGGFVDNPDDPGGATKWGITLGTFRTYIGNPLATVAMLKEINFDQVRNIYLKKYWLVMGCGNMPAGLDLMVFDHGVNGGDVPSVELLQRAVGVFEDGIVGPLTLGAIAARSVSMLITALRAEQLASYRRDRGFAEFGHGWMARLQRRYALAMSLIGMTS